MTPRIPLRICRGCPHYRGYCPLTDLDPCPQAEQAEDMRLRNRIGWAATLIVALLSAALLLSSCRRAPEPQPVVPKWSTMELLHAAHDDLTEWQMIQLAIIWTESKANPSALGANQDAGLYQLTPVYVREVNRVAGTDYAYEDAFDPDKAVEIFNTMQQFKNPGHDFELAVYYHNKQPQYLNKVRQNYELVRRYEAARKAVKK